MDSKIKTGVPYSFTFIREPFGNNSSQSMKKAQKAVAHFGDKKSNYCNCNTVTVLSVLSPADLGARNVVSIKKPTKLISF